MPFGIYPAKAVFKNRNLETGLQQVFGRVTDAIFRGDPHYINHLCAKQLQHFGKALPGGISALESRILLHRRVASLIKCKFLLHERQQIVVDLPFSGAGNAVRGPWAALFREGAVVGGMMVTYEEGWDARFLLQKGLGGRYRLEGMLAGKRASGQESIYSWMAFSKSSLKTSLRISTTVYGRDPRSRELFVSAV